MSHTKRQPEEDLAEDVDKQEERADSPATKKRRLGSPDYGDRKRYKECSKEIEAGIILRDYYPPEISNARANLYGTGELEKPITSLQNAIKETQAARDRIQVDGAVVHWYKNDLRIKDNTALAMASKKAKEKSVPLICIYLVSPQDFRAHLTAPARVDFILRNLVHLQQKLAELDIPLYCETVENRTDLPARLKDLCKKWRAKHIYCNMEYEVDELRREAKLTRTCLTAGINFTVVHDTCCVEPGKIVSNSGGMISVYSPWHRKWVAYLNQHANTLGEHPSPQPNPSLTRKQFADLFTQPIPKAPKDKALSSTDQSRLASLWPVGEEEAHTRLSTFISTRISSYHLTRNLPGDHGTSNLSVHLAAGTISSRTCVRAALHASPLQKLTDDRKQGHMMWIGEVAWRDFYKHVLVAYPYVCMNKCFKPEYTDIKWEYDAEKFKAWTEGRTGYPLIDAAMRQVKHMAYMHNRCRMVVASFLAKDLLIDWRMGERWFMENLIDGDFASNNGGWGFSASCGVDPQPYFRIFNPVLQSEKFDPEGEYIRRWVEELRDVEGKAVHDPWERGMAKVCKEKEYPRKIVEHKAAREKALEAYKEGIGRNRT